MSHPAVKQAPEFVLQPRSTLYHLFAQGFRYPTAESFAGLRSGSYQAELLDTLMGIPHLADLAENTESVGADLHSQFQDLAFEDFQARFVALYEVGNPEPPCPPYEGLHRPGQERTAVMLRTASFYKHFGLAMSREEGQREVADHICAELEFMHFLTFKESQAELEDNGELLQGYRLAQRDFLQQQLAQWIPAFAEKLTQHCDLNLYPWLANLLAQIVRREIEWLDNGLGGSRSNA